MLLLFFKRLRPRRPAGNVRRTRLTGLVKVQGNGNIRVQGYSMVVWLLVVAKRPELMLYV